MWVAQMDTQHFTFTALGETKAAAMEALKRGWEKHVEQINSEQKETVVLVPPMDEYTPIAIELAPGDCARDYEPMGVAQTQLSQWCPVCKTCHHNVGEATDAGRITRACPRLPTEDPRYYGSPVYTGDR